MNHLLRGVERSRCVLLASRRAFSSGKSASALGVGAPNLVPHAVSGGRYCHFPNDRYVPTRYLSSVSAEAVSAQSGDDATQDESSVEKPRQTPLEWAIKSATVEEKTPGHIIFYLQTYGAKKENKKYGKEIFQPDFIQLCESSRPGKMKDAKVIATALKTFKRNNNFILSRDGSWSAVEGMMRSMKPTWKKQDGRPLVRAALYVLEQFLDESTGLYFATDTKTINYLFNELHNGLKSMEESGFKMKVEKPVTNDDAEADDEAKAVEELSADEKLLSECLQVTGDVVKLLIKRKSRPEWDMKKRGKRKYLKHLQIGGGPYGSTLVVASEISILLGGSAAAQENIITPMDDAWWTSFVDDRALKLVKDAKKQEDEVLAEATAAAEKEAKALAEAAAAAEKEAKALEMAAAAAEDEANGEGVADEGSSVDGNVQGENEDTQKDVPSEEGKKD